jgi:hypothetical protein
MAMRTVDLALFADVVAARAAAIESRLERARDRIRQAAIEREARRSLPPATVERLVRVGALSAADVRAERREVAELAESLAALHDLQVWAEARLSEAQADAELGPPTGATAA